MIASVADPARTKRIVVIEDDVDHQKIAEMTLRSAGIQDITIFGTGEEALSYFEAFPAGTDIPAVIFIDLMLPNVSGIEILCALEKDERWSRCKKIVLTCSTSAEDRSLSQRCGADRFLVKPLRRETVKEILETLRS